MKCPNCGNENVCADDNFCGECKYRLAEGDFAGGGYPAELERSGSCEPGPLPQDLSASNLPKSGTPLGDGELDEWRGAEEPDSKPPEPQKEERSSPPADPVSPRMESQPLAPAASSPPATTVSIDNVSSESDCPDLIFNYNLSQVFLGGMNSIFDCEIIPRTPHLGDLFVHVLLEDARGLHWERKNVTVKKPPAGKPVPVCVNYTPQGIYGQVAYTLYIGYSRGGQKQCFEATVRHKVYPPDANARSVLGSLVINIKSVLKNTGHASDPSSRISLDGLESMLQRAQEKDPISKFIDEIERARLPVAVPLFESAYCPDCPAPAQDGAPPIQAELSTAADRLTLQKGNERLHLVALPPQGEIRLGRNRDCDVCARVLDMHGRLDKPACRVISRIHARFVYDPSGVTVYDGIEGDPSDFHLWLDGIRVEGFEPLALDETHLLLLGGPTERSAPLGYETTAWTVREVRRQMPRLSLPPGAKDAELAALYLRKRNGGCEHFLFLWHGCAAAPLDLGVRAGGFVRSGGGFLFYDDKRDEWLRPGNPVAGLNHWQVQEFNPLFPPHDK